MSDGLLCSDAQSIRNRRMPNGTYGGVRGRKTKVGGKSLLLFSSYSIRIVGCIVTPFGLSSPVSLFVVTYHPSDSGGCLKLTLALSGFDHEYRLLVIVELPLVLKSVEADLVDVDFISEGDFTVGVII